MLRDARCRGHGAPLEAARASSSPAPASGRGRREHGRRRVRLDVTVTSGHDVYTGFAESMSVGGLFIATPALEAVGARIDFSLALPGSDEPIRGSGVVRWVRLPSDASDGPPGLGVRFEELSRGAERRIAEFLEQRDAPSYDGD